MGSRHWSLRDAARELGIDFTPLRQVAWDFHIPIDEPVVPAHVIDTLRELPDKSGRHAGLIRAVRAFAMGAGSVDE